MRSAEGISAIHGGRGSQWSGRIKAGGHQEGLAAVKTVVGLLRATNVSVRAG
ncbi:hypothetical protein AB0H57_17525 [Micromonospora sp. NPDC050686]|uniref:hypothetical protein n=1 Tax=Micromonospora sp. NPDC050686 TaxID=3154631 RepID=UPI0033D4055C